MSVASWLLCAPHAIAATAFAPGQESVSGGGTAFAGGAAAANDASTIFYNPAGMTRLHDNQMMIGGQFLIVDIDYDEKASTLFNGSPISGGDGGQGGQNALVPHIYALYNLSSETKIGLGINAPFGLVTSYDDDWKGRYNEVTTSLKTINVNLAVAHRLTPELSVGGGLSAQRMQARLTQAIDFGSACAIALGAGTCAGTFGLAPGANDGSGDVDGTDVGFGFNMGVLYEFSPGTRMGFHYRSRINYKVDGDADFNVPAGARAFLTAAGLPNAYTQTGAHLSFKLPASASVSAYHEIDDRWAVMADVTWTRWRSFNEVLFVFDDQTPQNLLVTRWKNVFRVAAGATYRWSDRLLLRGGAAFDESPVRDMFRGPGVPDSNRVVVALGLGYALSDRMWMDASYQHLFFETGTTRRTSPTNSTLVGEFNNAVDVIGASLTVKF